MPSDTHTAVATVTKRELATMDFSEALEVYTPNFQAELPSHIPVERFKRTIITALNLNPDLRKADRGSLFNAAVKCAHDGLYPDGREAALVVYKTKAKNDKGQDVWLPMVQYLPMIAGIRKRMRNSGEVLSATAEVVYRNDYFKYIKGEDPRIEHEPPTMDKDRGDPVGAYAIIKLANGETLREVMNRADIERARSVSRSSDSKESPWVKWWDEMARKTVMRRCAKQAPVDSELDRLLSRDDERPPQAQDKVIPPRPTRQQFFEGTSNEVEPDTDDEQNQDTTGQGPGEAVSLYNFVDPIDGVAHSFDNPDEAADQMVALLKIATPEQFDAMIEARGTLIDQLVAEGRDDLEIEIMQIPRPAPESAARTAAPVAPAVTPKSVDLFTQTDHALRETAKGGLKAFQRAWLALPELQRDLVKPGRAEYEQLAREAGA